VETASGNGLFQLLKAFDKTAFVSPYGRGFRGAAHPRFPRPPGSVTGGYYCAALRAMSAKNIGIGSTLKGLYANDLELFFRKSFTKKKILGDSSTKFFLYLIIEQ